MATNEVVVLLAIECFFIEAKSFVGRLAKSKIDVSDACARRFKKIQKFLIMEHIINCLCMSFPLKHGSLI